MRERESRNVKKNDVSVRETNKKREREREWMDGWMDAGEKEKNEDKDETGK